MLDRLTVQCYYNRDLLSILQVKYWCTIKAVKARCAKKAYSGVWVTADFFLSYRPLSRQGMYLPTTLPPMTCSPRNSAPFPCLAGFDYWFLPSRPKRLVLTRLTQFRGQDLHSALPVPHLQALGLPALPSYPRSTHCLKKMGSNAKHLFVLYAVDFSGSIMMDLWPRLQIIQRK